MHGAPVPAMPGLGHFAIPVILVGCSQVCDNPAKPGELENFYNKYFLVDKWFLL